MIAKCRCNRISFHLNHKAFRTNWFLYQRVHTEHEVNNISKLCIVRLLYVEQFIPIISEASSSWLLTDKIFRNSIAFENYLGKRQFNLLGRPMQEVSAKLCFRLFLLPSHFAVYIYDANFKSQHFKHLRNYQLLNRFKLQIMTRGQDADLRIAGAGRTPLDFTIIQRRRTKC